MYDGINGLFWIEDEHESTRKPNLRHSPILCDQCIVNTAVKRYTPNNIFELPSNLFREGLKLSSKTGFLSDYWSPGQICLILTRHCLLLLFLLKYYLWKWYMHNMNHLNQTKRYKTQLCTLYSLMTQISFLVYQQTMHLKYLLQKRCDIVFPTKLPRVLKCWTHFFYNISIKGYARLLSFFWSQWEINPFVSEGQ